MILFETTIILICIFTVNAQNCSVYTNSSLPIQVHAHETAFYATLNLLYLFGGRGTDDNYLNSIYKWDLNENIWTLLSIRTPNLNMFYTWGNNAVTIHNIVYFIGMDDDSYDSGAVYLFNLNTAQWMSNSVITSPHYPSIRGCLTQNATHIFLVGGQISSNQYIDQLQVYDISNNFWSTETIDIAPIHNNGWVNGFCQSINHNLYVFGGGLTEWDVMNNMFKYNAINKWSSIGTLPNAQSCGSAVYHEPSGAIYITGGVDGSGDKQFDAVYVFDVETETIIDSLTMISAKDSVAVEIINDRLYIFGGCGANDALSTIETCTIFKTERTTTSEPTTLNPTTPEPTAKPTTSEPTTSEPTTTTTISYSTANTIDIATSDAIYVISTTLKETNTAESILIAPTINTNTSYITATNDTTAENTEYIIADTDITVAYVFVALVLVALFICVCILILLFILMGYHKKNQQDVQMNATVVNALDNAPKVVPIGTNVMSEVVITANSEDRMAQSVELHKAVDHEEGANVVEQQTTIQNINIAPDEFIVIGDDETNDGFTNTSS